MGVYLNPGKGKFQETVNSKIYVDKTELLEYTNSVLCSNQKHICVSRPRRFGKSITANMLTAYYGRNEDSSDLSFYSKKTPTSKVGDELRQLPTC